MQTSDKMTVSRVLALTEPKDHVGDFAHVQIIVAKFNSEHYVHVVTKRKLDPFCVVTENGRVNK
jgi:hypothetical protein